jgi:hypothetical protein
MKRHHLLLVLFLCAVTLGLIIWFAINLGSISAFSGRGKGNSEDPYQITNCTQLQEIKEGSSANYILMNNIDCSDTVNWNEGAGFKPIIGFSGIFDGQDYKITALYINSPLMFNVSLFGFIDTGAVVSNLGLENVDITGGENTGGLIGVNRGTVTACYSSGSVDGSSYVGGLVGKQETKALVDNSYSTANVISIGKSAGGLVARNYGTITNSYSIGNVNGGSYVGGLVGTGGGGTTTNSFWNTETSEQASSGGGTGKTTLEMKIQSTFTNAGWDFVNVWEIEEGISYPYLLWQKDSDNDGIYGMHDLCPSENPNGVDADLNGCIDNLIDFSDVIVALPNELLSRSIENSLLSKINNALMFFNGDKDTAAINMLGAFINQVEAQRGKKISGETADMLIEYANNIIAQIKAGETP